MYPKDTEKWKQFTTRIQASLIPALLLCIPKILKNESNSQRSEEIEVTILSCCVSQRYWKMKAIHNSYEIQKEIHLVVVYPKDTEKWKQFTTDNEKLREKGLLLCIPKILKNESNSQLFGMSGAVGGWARTECLRTKFTKLPHKKHLFFFIYDSPKLQESL